MRNSSLFTAFIFLLVTSAAYAETTVYVTDRILLGVHQQPSENSPIIVTIPSGTAITLIQRQDSFAKVRLADGKEGWVSESYLKTDKPATAELDVALAKLQKEQETGAKLAADLNKAEREVQVRRDELSNATTTIKDLQKKLKETNTQPAGEVDTEALDKANATIEEMKKIIAQLESEKATQTTSPVETDSADIQKLQNQTKNLQVRIEAALANLKGEKVPTPEELAAIRPHFPFWYWLLLIALFVGGITAGFAWFDYRHRSKHGGFRI